MCNAIAFITVHIHGEDGSIDGKIQMLKAREKVEPSRANRCMRERSRGAHHIVIMHHQSISKKIKRKKIYIYTSIYIFIYSLARIPPGLVPDILFVSRYFTSPSMGSVLYEIFVRSIARSFLRSIGRSLGGQERARGEQKKRKGEGRRKKEEGMRQTEGGKRKKEDGKGTK